LSTLCIITTTGLFLPIVYRRKWC